MTETVLAAWYFTTLMRAILLGALFKRRLALRYPCFTAFLALSLVATVSHLAKSIFRVDVGVWLRFQIPMLMLTATLVLEVYYLMAKHFERIGWWGPYVLIWFTVIAAAVVWLTARWWDPDNPALILSRVAIGEYPIATAALLLRLSVGHFRKYRSVRMTVNVVTHARILCWFLAAQAVGFGIIAQGWGKEWNFVGQIMHLGAVGAACFFWLQHLRPSGEQLEPLRV